jgi:hypothetical protein
VFYRQHNPASRQEKAVAISYILKECLQAVRWKRIYTRFNRSIVLVLVLVVAFPSPFRWQRSEIDDDDDDEHEQEHDNEDEDESEGAKTFDQHP